MTWHKTPDPDLIEYAPYFITQNTKLERYLLGRDLGRGVSECLGGFDSEDAAKAECERIMNETKQGAA